MKTPEIRQDRVDQAVTSLDDVFQRFTATHPNYAVATRTPAAQEKLDTIFGEIPNQTKPGGRAIIEQVKVFIAECMATMDRDEAIAAEGQDVQRGRMIDILYDETGKIDSRLITRTLLENLGLGEHAAPKGTKRVERTLQHLKAIPDIEDMLAHLEPLLRPDETKGRRNGYFRLSRIGKGKNKGYVLGTQHAIKGSGKKQKIFFKTDINNARLRIEHIEQQYEQEIKTLTDIQGTLDRVHQDLGFWQDIKNTDRLEELKRELFEKAESLELARDEDKETLRKRLESCMTLEDSSGKPNPGAMRAALLKTSKYVGRRLKTMSETSGNLTQDKLRVQQKVHQIKQPIDRFLSQVERHRDEQKPARPKAEKLRDLKSLLAQTGNINLEPYQSFAANFKDNLERLIATLQKPAAKQLELGLGEDPARLFLNLFILAKFQRAYEKLSQVYRTITLNGEDFDPAQMKDDLETFSDELYESRIHEKHEVHDYDDQVGQIYHIINSLMKCCDEKMGTLDSSKNTHDDEVDMPLPERMKKRMNEYIPDWVSLARSLKYPAEKTA